jgi:hypothetical protein
MWSACHHEDSTMSHHKDRQHHQTRTTKISPQVLAILVTRVCGHDAQIPMDGTSSLPGKKAQRGMDNPSRQRASTRSSINLSMTSMSMKTLRR